MIALLDPRKGDRYVKPVKEKLSWEELENIYNVTPQRDDYVNTTSERMLS